MPNWDQVYAAKQKRAADDTRQRKNSADSYLTDVTNHQSLVRRDAATGPADPPLLHAGDADVRGRGSGRQRLPRQGGAALWAP